MPFPDLNLDDAVFTEFGEAWLKCRGSDELPLWSEEFLGHSEMATANLMLFELVSKTDIRIRFIGDDVIARDGRSKRGQNYLEFVDRYRRAKASEAMFAMNEQPAGMSVVVNSASDKGALLILQNFGLPFANSSGQPRFAGFVSKNLTRMGVFDVKKDRPHQLEAMERRFIDIGYGTPDFSD